MPQSANTQFPTATHELDDAEIEALLGDLTGEFLSDLRAPAYLADTVEKMAANHLPRRKEMEAKAKAERDEERAANARFREGHRIARALLAAERAQTRKPRARKPRPACRFPGCGRDASIRGLCNSHVYQERKGGPLRPIGEYRAEAAAKKAARLEEAARRRQERARIRDEQARLREEHEASAPRRRTRVGKPCSVEGCEATKHKAKGLCAAHYWTLRGSCSEKNCENKVKARGKCYGHYQELLAALKAER